jgi:hypothetical protein
MKLCAQHRVACACVDASVRIADAYARTEHVAASECMIFVFSLLVCYDVGMLLDNACVVDDANVDCGNECNHCVRMLGSLFSNKKKIGTGVIYCEYSMTSQRT